MDDSNSSSDDFGSSSSSFDDGDDSDSSSDYRSGSSDYRSDSNDTSAGSRTTVRRNQFDDGSDSFDDSNDFGSSSSSGSSGGFDDDSSSSGFDSGDSRTSSDRSNDPFDERSSSSRSGSGSAFGNSASSSDEYVVQSGDNYWSISRKLYGTSKYYMALAKANSSRIPDPARMRPGMKIEVPSLESLGGRSSSLSDDRRTASRETRFGSNDRSADSFSDSSTSDSSTSDSSTSDNAGAAGYFTGIDGEPRYRVGSRDTLSEIAQKHLGRGSRWVQLYSMNRERLSDPNRLTIGTILHLPSDASRVRVVRKRASFR
jgi:nucleoid-associated protein YgaU